MNNWTRNNGFFNFYGFIAPTLNVVWVEDHALLTWNDIYGGRAAYRVYVSRNGGAYTPVFTTALGATNAIIHTWQNETVSFRISALAEVTESQPSIPVTIRTPLCFWTDQALLPSVTLDTLNIGGAGVVRVDWGEGLFNNYNGANAALNHIYANPGQYCVRFSGAVDLITALHIHAQVVNYGNLCMWSLPAGLLTLELTGCTFTGDLAAWVLPAGLLILDLTNNLFTGDLSRWFIIGMPPNITNIRLLTGNVFSGDVPAWIMGVTMPNGLVEINAPAMQFSGDLNQVSFPAGAAPIDVNFHDNHFRSLPRGNFRWVRTLDMSDNYIPQEELDSFLCHLNQCFTLGVVPLVNITITITGVNMGCPSGSNPPANWNPNVIALAAKYAAAAVLFTLVFN